MLIENFTTKQPYQGCNIQRLAGLGTQFCTFNQAIKYFKLSGKELKGAKKSARLMKIVKKKEFNKKTKKLEEKMVPFYFNVFEKKHLEDVIRKNTK